MAWQADDLTIRPAENKDATLLYFWRNCRHGDWGSSVNWNEHLEWMQSENVFSFLGEVDGRPVGYCHYARKGECYEISIYVMPEFRLMGYAETLIKKTMKTMADTQHGVIAFTRSHAAAKLFLKCGFLKQGLGWGGTFIYTYGVDIEQSSETLRQTCRTAWSKRSRWWAWLRGKQEA